MMNSCNGPLKGSSFNDYVVKFSTDPKDFNPLFDVKEFRSAQFQRVYQYLKLSKEGKNMDNFTFVPGNIDNDKNTCLSLLLRFVIKTVNSLEATAFFGLFISKLIFVSSWYISWIFQLLKSQSTNGSRIFGNGQKQPHLKLGVVKGSHEQVIKSILFCKI